MPNHQEIVSSACATRDQWLRHGLSTEPSDRPAAESAIIELYDRARLRPPTFCWTRSPRDALEEIARQGLSTSLTQGLPPSGRIAGMFASALRRLDLQISAHSPLAREDARSLPPAEALIHKLPLELILLAAVRDSLRMTLFCNVARAIRTTAPRTVNEIPWYGQQEAHRVAVYDVLRQYAAGPRPESLLEVHARIVRSTGWWWGFDGVCVLAERPATLHTVRTPTGVHNERWLHNPNGPAIEFTDGSRVFVFNGTVVPEWVVLEPTVERIAREPDRAIRRCAIERLGWERYLDEASLRLVDGDDAAGLYTDGRRHVLVVGPPANATLHVPVSARSAREALAWTRGLRGDAA